MKRCSVRNVRRRFWSIFFFKLHYGIKTKMLFIQIQMQITRYILREKESDDTGASH
jgi:hypothetical protein